MATQGSAPFDSKVSRREAAGWLARRDRGLTATEQDDYLQWLGENPAHAAVMAEQEAALGRLMGLSSWQPEMSSIPDPDLFAPRARFRRYGWWWAAAAAVIAAALALSLRGPRGIPRESESVPSHLVAVEPRILPDGSRLEIREGSAVDAQSFSRTQRRLTLVDGEAAFTVMKDSSHPFIVEAGGIAVRAVGTVFDVQLGSDSVAVLVSEGKVGVEQPGGGGPVLGPDGSPLYVSAGERAVIPIASTAHASKLARLGADEVSDDLAWRSPRFQFYETPLGQAIDEFNRRNRAQIALSDGRLRAISIGGTFRADNVEGFVRMLESTLGVRAVADNQGGYTLIGWSALPPTR